VLIALAIGGFRALHPRNDSLGRGIPALVTPLVRRVHMRLAVEIHSLITAEESELVQDRGTEPEPSATRIGALFTGKRQSTVACDDLHESGFTNTPEPFRN